MIKEGFTGIKQKVYGDQGGMYGHQMVMLYMKVGCIGIKKGVYHHHERVYPGP